MGLHRTNRTDRHKHRRFKTTVIGFEHSGASLSLRVCMFQSKGHRKLKIKDLLLFAEHFSNYIATLLKSLNKYPTAKATDSMLYSGPKDNR